MAEAKGREEAIEQLGKLIKDIRTAMMVTIGDRGMPRGRPMYTQEVPFDGVLWFLTSVDSRKVRELRRNATVQLGYVSTSDENYVSVTGTASVLNDRARIAEFWNPFLKAWYEGPDDPTLRLLRVDVDRAEFWDSPGGKIGSFLSIAKAIVTGKEDDGGHGEVRFDGTGERATATKRATARKRGATAKTVKGAASKGTAKRTAKTAGKTAKRSRKAPRTSKSAAKTSRKQAKKRGT